MHEVCTKWQRDFFANWITHHFGWVNRTANGLISFLFSHSSTRSYNYQYYNLKSVSAFYLALSRQLRVPAEFCQMAGKFVAFTFWEKHTEFHLLQPISEGKLSYCSIRTQESVKHGFGNEHTFGNYICMHIKMWRKGKMCTTETAEKCTYFENRI